MIWEIFNAFFNYINLDLTGRHPKSFTILSFLPINNGTSLERILFLSINNAINFLKKFCLERLNQEFNKNYKDFNPHQFLQNYHDFLMYAGYYHFGIVRTGAYLIWRALIKYLEDLQGEDEFQVKKGAFLGNWCYKQANKNGFTPEKLILINSNKKPIQRYKDMRKQVESFPKTPIFIDVDFPKDDKSYFHEIDFLGLTKFLENMFEHIKEFIAFTNEVVNRSKQNTSRSLLSIVEEVFKETAIDLKLERFFKEFTKKYILAKTEFGVMDEAYIVALEFFSPLFLALLELLRINFSLIQIYSFLPFLPLFFLSFS